MTEPIKHAVIGIDQWGNRRRICVEDSQAAAQQFIDSQRVDYTYTTHNGYLSNFNHNHILRGYVDAVTMPLDEDDRDELD